MLFISHDLALVGGICDRVCVLHDGQLVEELPGGREMYEKAEHPYTRLLMKSVLISSIIKFVTVQSQAKFQKNRYKMLAFSFVVRTVYGRYNGTICRGNFGHSLIIVLV